MHGTAQLARMKVCKEVLHNLWLFRWGSDTDAPYIVGKERTFCWSPSQHLGAIASMTSLLPGLCLLAPQLAWMNDVPARHATYALTLSVVSHKSTALHDASRVHGLRKLARERLDVMLQMLLLHGALLKL